MSQTTVLSPLCRALLYTLVVTIGSSVVYFTSFYTMRARIPVTTFEGIPLYYFSRNHAFNKMLWKFYWPFHQSGQQPVTTTEWIVEQKNCQAFYVRDVAPWNAILSEEHGRGRSQK